MKLLFIILISIWFHIIDDFCLQQVLAKLKQKKNWLMMDGYNDKYKYDYVICLLAHAFEWAIMIMIPIMVYQYINGFMCYFELCSFIIINTIIHALVDDQKANQMSINLVQDQLIHLIQIIGTVIILYSML